MDLLESCRERFLDGITDAYFYEAQACTIPIPSAMPRVLQINGCKFAGEALHLALSEGSNYVVAESITAKQTSKEGGNGTVFTFEVTSNIEAGKENIPEIIKNMHGKDYYIVLRKQDDTLHLCYTLLGTFAIADAKTNQNNAETCSVTATCLSMSEFVSITLA